jgi:RHS repeat-associated protein
MGHVVTTAYTADGQVASVTDNLSHSTSYSYGHDGELLSTTDPLSHVTSDSYNNRLWLTSTTDPNNGTTQYGYDSHGNLTSLTDSVGNEDQYTYSSTNQVLTDTNQLGYARTYVYNASGDVTQETDRNGLVRNFTLDNLHRETAEKWMSGGSSIYTISYAYNADNQVTSASDPDSSYAYSYDNLGRVTSLDNSGTPNIPHVVLSNQYDLMNDRTQLTATVAGTADFINAYSYDADQRMLQATQEGQTGGNGVAPKGIGYAYNLDGQMTSVLRFDPTTSSPHPDIAYGTLSYDAANRLTEIKYTHSGNTLDDLTWTYDAASRVTSFTSSVDGTATYSYDSINEVTAASYTGTNQPANESYSFDKNGNRTNTGYSTGTNNQLTSDGTFNYTYDHEGNRLTRTRISSGQANDYKTTYSWDYRNRLTDVNYYNNSNTLTKHVHYVYDVYDHLIGEQLDPTGSGSYTSSEWYALDLPSMPGAPVLPVLQFGSTGNLTYRYLDAPSWTGVDAVMAEESVTTQGSAGTTTYALSDNLGSGRDIVNTSSMIVDHIVYSSFGQVVSESGTVHHWSSYAGYHLDANTGLAYADHRWYDPNVGRWISEDPIGFRAGDPNVSRYVGNSTTKFVDPTGLAPPEDPPGPPQGVPQVDFEGRIHDPIPKEVPDQWDTATIQEALDNVDKSIANRQQQGVDHGGMDKIHDNRLKAEKTWRAKLMARLQKPVTIRPRGIGPRGIRPRGGGPRIPLLFGLGVLWELANGNDLLGAVGECIDPFSPSTMGDAEIHNSPNEELCPGAAMLAEQVDESQIPPSENPNEELCQGAAIQADQGQD